MKIDRRHLLKMGAASLAAPFLRLDEAHATVSGQPKRFVIFHHPQGTTLSQWAPVGSTTSFTLPFITAPLEPLRQHLAFVTGLDNLQADFYPAGNSHERSDYTVFTGLPYHSPTEQLTAGGPSIDEVIAQRLAAPTPFRRLDFVIGNAVSNGITQCSRFFAGPYDRIAGFNDPLVALLRIFGDQTLSPADEWALRSRRSGVLDVLTQNFAHLRGRIPAHQRGRLDTHLARVEELDARITAGTGACIRPELNLPPGYDPSWDDDVTAPLMAELAVKALACDYTRVATIEFANGHGHTYPWLWGENGGLPVVDPTFDNWHAMVHADFIPGMEYVYRWYMTQFADFLTRMANETDADGDNLLETSLVLYMPEFNSGRHTPKALPAILAGCIPSAGQYHDFMGTNRDAFLSHQHWGLQCEANTNQLMVGILQAFGQPDVQFGRWDPNTPDGPLPGVFG